MTDLEVRMTIKTLARKGISNRTIARQLGLTDGSVRDHLKRQGDLDEWMNFNNERTHQGKMCCGRTPLDTLIDAKEVWKQKRIAGI